LIPEVAANKNVIVVGDVCVSGSRTRDWLAAGTRYAH